MCRTPYKYRPNGATQYSGSCTVQVPDAVTENRMRKRGSRAGGRDPGWCHAAFVPSPGLD
eukprot:365059-Chlamydomonas_euryale.AAC.5